MNGPIRASALNLEGDEQSDLSVHGGRDKAVYAYPHEHYDFWRRELPIEDLPLGAFGENLTTEGMLEADIEIGDRIRIGSVEFLVTQPRTPCYKLGIRFGRDDMVKRFLHSGRSGFYLAVLREGELAPGASIDFARRADHGVTVADIASLYAREVDDEELLRRAVEVPALPEGWKEYFRKRLSKPDV